MPKYRISKVTLRLPDNLVKHLDQTANNYNISHNELIRQIFESDFGHKRKDKTQDNNTPNNIKVSFLIPENVVSYMRKRASHLGIGYTTYARHYLQKKFGLDFT